MSWIFLYYAVACILGLLYFLFFRKLIRGWESIPEYKAPAVEKCGSEQYSIIIPARNEERNLSDCLLDLIRQNFPPQQFEIIVADDHSTDRTAALAEEFIKKHPEHQIRLLRMGELPRPEGFAYKKYALTKAIDLARHPWIITTDADCRRGADWLRTLDAFVQKNDFELVSLPVEFTTDNSYFKRVQALEFLGLIGIGAASICLGRPTMCNGANLAFSKKVFAEVGGYAGVSHLASGDDELLMHKVHERHPTKVLFLKNRDAAVSTRSADSLRELLEQRRRWVSKSTKYSDKRITLVMILAWLFNFLILASVLLSPRWPVMAFVALTLGIVKLVAEYSFLRKVTHFFKLTGLMRVFISGSLLHVLYVVFIGIYGNFGAYTWKGRRVK